MAGRRGGTAAAARKPSKQKHNDKFTIVQVVAALEAAGGIKSIAAKKLGCDPTTVHGYAKRYWEVEEAIARISDEKLDFAEAKLLKHIDDGNLTAIIFFLRRRARTGAGWSGSSPPAGAASPSRSRRKRTRCAPTWRGVSRGWLAARVLHSLNSAPYDPGRGAAV